MLIRKTDTHGDGANNLNTLRLVLAGLVLVAHANDLFAMARPGLERNGFFLFHLSDVAVSAFFVLSGYLTWASWVRDNNTLRFYIRRAFRVLPAYWMVIAAQVVVFLLVFRDRVIPADILPYTLFSSP